MRLFYQIFTHLTFDQILNTTQSTMYMNTCFNINPLDTELNPICNLLALLGAHHILHVSRIRVKETPPFAHRIDLCALYGPQTTNTCYFPEIQPPNI